MLKNINRNNQLFMLGNFIFALSYGLWMNLRQLHLGDLGASPAEIGTVFGVISITGGILPLPAGLLTDRLGPKRVILGAWGIAAIGTLVASIASNWQLASVGFCVFMLVIAANPATVTYVLLNTPEQDANSQAEHVMATVFASWPAAMIVAPTLGGLIADRWGIAADLGIGALGLVLALLTFALAADIRPPQVERRSGFAALIRNHRFLTLTIFYPLVLLALELAFVLAPTFLQSVRDYSAGMIGFLFSILSVGSLIFNYIVGKAQSQLSFVVLVSAVWVGTILLLLSSNPVLTGIAFLLWGAISTMWLLAQTTFGKLVDAQSRGLALGITETIAWSAIALAAWLAGQLYEYTPTHDLPLLVGVISILVVLLGWLVIGRFTRSNATKLQTSTNQQG